MVLGFLPGVLGKFRCQLLDYKFLKQISDSSSTNPDGSVLECKARSVAILRWIIEIRNTARSKAPEHIRVIRLPASVVSLANHRISDRIQRSRWCAADSFVKITRILFQQRRQDGGANKRSRHRIGVASAEAFSISLCALPIFAEVILRLFHSRSTSHKYESEWIDYCLPGKLELLLRGEWNCVGDIADIEIWQDSEYPLLLFNLDLLFGKLTPLFFRFRRR